MLFCVWGFFVYGPLEVHEDCPPCVRTRAQDVEDRTRPGAGVYLSGLVTFNVNDQTMRRHSCNNENESLGRPREEHPEDCGYTQEDLDRMYQEAFEGDSEARWNID